jgi:hypothetical protein
MPVVPEAVGQSLLSWKATEGGTPQRGLLTRIYEFQYMRHEGFAALIPDTGLLPGTFLLLQISSLFDEERVSAFGGNLVLFQQFLRRERGRLESAFSRRGDHWVWLQSLGHTLWFWDAEGEPLESRGDPRNERTVVTLLRATLAPGQQDGPHLRLFGNMQP